LKLASNAQVTRNIDNVALGDLLHCTSLFSFSFMFFLCFCITFMLITRGSQLWWSSNFFGCLFGLGLLLFLMVYFSKWKMI